MTENLIIDGERKYFVMVPNIIDDLGLSVYAFRLYVHMKRRAGEGLDGKCFESTKNLAKLCSMSIGKVTASKKELADNGLITIETKNRPSGGRPYHEIKISDVWKANVDRFSKGNDHLGDSNSKEEQVHHVNLASSPRELTSSPREPKKNPHNKNPLNENPKREGSNSEEEESQNPSLSKDFNLFDTIVEELKKSGQGVDADRLYVCIEAWRLVCAEALSEGKRWNPNNVNAILERYAPGGIENEEPYILDQLIQQFSSSEED